MRNRSDDRINRVRKTNNMAFDLLERLELLRFHAVAIVKDHSGDDNERWFSKTFLGCISLAKNFRKLLDEVGLEFASVNDQPFTIGKYTEPSGHHALVAIAEGKSLKLATCLVGSLVRNSTQKTLDDRYGEANKRLQQAFSSAENFAAQLPDIRDEFSAIAPGISEKTSRKLAARLEWEILRVQNRAVNAADSKTDNRKKIKAVVPRNPDVVKLARHIRQQLPQGGSMNCIALAFTSGDEKRANSLLRQLRGDRYKHLLG